MVLAWLVIMALPASLAAFAVSAKNLGLSSRMRRDEDDEQMWSIRSDGGASERDVVATLS